MNHIRKFGGVWEMLPLSLLVIILMLTAQANSALARNPEEKPVSNQFISRLSDREQAWLREHPIIRVAQDPGWPPVEFINEQGEFSGISQDYLNLVEQLLGVKFERVKNLTWLAAFTQLKRWEIDMTTSVTVTPQRAEFWAFTKPYLTLPIVIATQMDVTYIADIRELLGKEVAVVENYAIDEWLKKDFPDIRRVHVNSARQGLEMLQRGQVFAYLDNLLIIGYYQAKMKASSIKIAGQTPYANAQCMAVRKDWAPLAGILQKALESIQETQRKDIYRKWLPVRYEHGFNYVLFWKVVAVLGMVILLLIIWNWKLAREIASRKRVEETLRRSEERFRTIFEQSPLGVALTDSLTGRLREFNRRFAEICGRTMAEMHTTDWMNITHPEDVQKDLDNMALMNQGKIPGFTMNKRYCRPDGSHVWVNMIIAQMPEKDGQHPQHLCMIEDISERKQSEEELITERIFVDAIFDSIPGILYLYDAEGQLIRWNKKHELMTGYSSEELSNMHLMDWYPGDEQSQKTVTEGLKRTMENGFGEAEAILQRKDGSRLPLYFTASPLKINGKQYFTGIGIDITERRRAEQERQNLQTRLSQAQKMEAIGTLAGGIAHDFNNILSGIFGYIQLAKIDINEPESTKKYMDKIFEGAQRASSLIQQILTFSRQTSQIKQPISLFSLVKEALKLIRSTIPANIEIKEALNSKAMVWADSTQMHQIIMNLCTNASHSMADRGGVLTIGLDDFAIPGNEKPQGIDLAPGKYIKFEVTDTGSGIDPGIKEKIFNPYFTTKEISKGTGLGLAVVDGILKKHKGFIELKTQLGLGTTFQIYLPAFEKKMPSNAAKVEKIALPEGTERILLVDDEAAILDTLTAILNRRGYIVSPFNNGESALQAFMEAPHNFDLIITDMTMPKMNGDKLSGEILKIREKIPIIICTGYHEKFTSEEAVKTGIKKYIQKPVMARELLRIVRELLDKN